MNQTHIVSKINVLINSLDLLKTNYYRLSLQLDNPTFDYLRQKITDLQLIFEKEYTNYSGNKISKQQHLITALVSDKERLAQNISSLHQIRTSISEITNTVIASNSFKNSLIQISKLCAREIVLIQNEIRELDNDYTNIALINKEKLLTLQY